MKIIEHDEEYTSDLSLYLFVLFLLISGCISLFLYQGHLNSDQFKSLGTWGDFVGGVLNPILTFITFGGVLVTIYLQQKELSLNRREMKRSATALENQLNALSKQNFDSAFFQMIALHNQILNSIDLRNDKYEVIALGRDCFRTFYTRLNKLYRQNRTKGFPKYSDERILKLSYYLFWKEVRTDLGHYYRYLYNIFKFIDESGTSNEYYVKILRAQISDQELLLLFYNCMSSDGKNFQKYAIKYALFDNMPLVQLLQRDHQQLMDPLALGENLKPITSMHN